MAELAQLLSSTVIGCFTHFEVTEVFMSVEGQPVANVFTILVAEERNDVPPLDAKFLGDRIRLKKFNDAFFGINRYVRPIGKVATALDELDQGREWMASGKALQFGKLHKVPPQFVPPDSTTYPPWNRVLKNNFWNGSYVVEWSDREKSALNPLFEDSRLLQELADQVQEQVPIDLAALSDRLGNLVVQLPVTAIMSQFAATRGGDCTVRVAWHPKVPPRPLRAMSGFEFDRVVTGLALESVQPPETLLKTSASRGMHGGVIWDEQNGVILAASGPTGFIEVIHLNIAPLDSEPRTLSFTDRQGNARSEEIAIMGGGPGIRVGDPHVDDTGGRTRERLYRAQLEQLIREKAFVPYGAKGLPPAEERKRALADLRDLMSRHGRIGVWLWDPYLDSDDILETLIYCPYSGSDLRALTAASEPPRCEERPSLSTPSDESGSPTHKQRFISAQRDRLNNVTGNWRGIRLEFRARHGGAGWGFHDRFIIFPQTDAPALAWSLGTSVNSLGGDHHILQKVTLNVLLSFAQFEREVTGERIRDKFAASKRKGMWMGGNPPLGYDVSNRKLVVNLGEAETVRLIFRRYLDLGCVRLLCSDLKDRGVVSKPRSSSNGKSRGGKPIERSALYLILNNRTYIGETTHKGNSYPGEHQAIVPRDLFDRVQQRLADLRPPVRVATRAVQDAPLAGLLFDETGTPMLPTYTVKGQNRRYRYYTSRPAMKGEASRAVISRIPAPPLEHLMSRVLRRLDLPADTLRLAIDRVDIRANDVAIHIKRAEAIAVWRSTGREARQRTDRQILADRRALLESGEALVDDGADLILSLPVRARFRGGDATVHHPSGMTTPRQDPALIKALARAHQWRNMLLNGEAKSIEALAKHFGLDRGHVGLTLNLAFLSPTITRAIVRGEQPSDLRLSRLLRETVPLSWREQEAMFTTATAAQK